MPDAEPPTSPAVTPEPSSASRQVADLILIGEAQQFACIALAITDVAIGLLLFGTLQPGNPSHAIDQIIGAFPASGQNLVRRWLSESLAEIASQPLLPPVLEGRRIAPRKILLPKLGPPDIIREGNTPLVGQIFQAGRNKACSRYDVLFAYTKEGPVGARHSWLKATDRPHFEPLLTQSE
jgi:Tfp pilus assembly pilus retraction ATPase PilT